jgi:hypothetical protein
MCTSNTDWIIVAKIGEGGHCTPLVYVCQPTALIASEGYHLVVCISICVNRMARPLEEPTGKYAGEASVIVQDVEKVNA